MNHIPAVPLKLRIPPPLMDPIRSAALTRLVREGSTRVSAFFLPARERQPTGSSRGSHHPPRLFRRNLPPSPSRPLRAVYALSPLLSTVFIFPLDTFLLFSYSFGCIFVYRISEDKVEGVINRMDKSRANYYQFYSDNDWGDMKNYDLCLNSGKLGVDGCVRLIVSYLKIRGLIDPV